MIAEFCLAFILAIATLRSPLSNYSLALLVFSCLIPACVSWINPCLAIRTFFAPRLDYCCVPGLSLFALPLLDIVRRSKTHACLRTTLCLALTIPVCRCLTLPVYWLFINKAQQMDPLASCLVGSVTQTEFKQCKNIYFVLLFNI